MRANHRRLIDKDTDESLSNIISFHDAARPESQSSQHSTNPDETGVYRFHAAPGRVLVMVSAPLGYQDIGEVRDMSLLLKARASLLIFSFQRGWSRCANYDGDWRAGF